MLDIIPSSLWISFFEHSAHPFKRCRPLFLLHKKRNLSLDHSMSLSKTTQPLNGRMPT